MTPEVMKNRLMPFIEGIIKDEGFEPDNNWEALFESNLEKTAIQKLVLLALCVKGFSRISAPFNKKEVL